MDNTGIPLNSWLLVALPVLACNEMERRDNPGACPTGPEDSADGFSVGSEVRWDIDEAIKDHLNDPSS